MRIKFTQTYKVKDATGKEYNAGDVLNCSVATANHFTRRGVAEVVPAEKKAQPAEEPAVERSPVGRPSKKAAVKRATGGDSRTG